MRASRVVSSVIYNYVNVVFMAGTGFVYTAFMLRHLSHSSFGILTLTGSLLTYAGLLNFGIGLTVMKMIIERVHGDRDDEIPRIAGNALILYGAISAIAVIAALSIEPFAGSAFHLTGANVHTFRVALAIATIGLAVILPSAFYTGVHAAYQDYRYIAILGMATQAVSVVAGIILLLKGFGVIALVIVGSAQGVITLVLKVEHAHRKFGLRPQLGRMDWGLARQMLATSVWVLLLNVAAQAIYSSDVIVVGAVLGTAAVASYQVALGPALGVKLVSDTFSSVSLNAAASLNAEKAYEELRRLLSEATRVVIATVAPGVVIFALWGRRLIQLWAGRAYESSYATLVVLSLALLIAALQGPAAQLLFAVNHYRRLALLSLAEAAVNVGLSIVLAKRIGIVGVAWGTAIPISLMTVLFYIPMACRRVGLTYRLLARRLALPVAVNGGAFVVLRLLTHDGSIFPDIEALLAASFGVFLVCFSLSILLDPTERNTYIDMVRGLAQRLRP